VNSTLLHVVLPSSAPAGPGPVGCARLVPVGSATQLPGVQRNGVQLPGVQRPGVQGHGVEGSGVPAVERRSLIAPLTTPTHGTALLAAGYAVLPTTPAAAPMPSLRTAPLANDVQGPLSRGTPV
jgi:hypothetical protein